MKAAVGSTLVTLLFGLILGLGAGPLPPLGPLLSPYSGVWRNIPAPKEDGRKLLFASLRQSVEIFWDKNNIPHIFAANNEDLYFAQGYITAQDRLFQMDLHTRFAAGRLSELTGEKALPLDELFVRSGMRQAAQKALEEIQKNKSTWTAIKSFVAGVNAYIESLDSQSLPPEYKILDTYPERWTPIRVAHLLKMMAYRLSGRSLDLELTQILQKFGPEKTKDLFPNYFSIKEPLSPNSSTSEVELMEAPSKIFTSQLSSFPEHVQPYAQNGSNNWAVGGQRTKTGYPILSNDTHLAYGLPAIWYEQQLVSPTQNVYGVSIAGAPTALIGFTKSLSWGITNSGSDVVDWYETDIRNQNGKLEYLLNKEWRTPTIFEEKILVKGGEAKKLEVPWTEQGVLVHSQDGLGLILRWTAHEASNELLSFIELNQGRTLQDCESAIQSFRSPAQNFVCADTRNIGLWHQGSFPKRYEGHGKFILDGRENDKVWESRWGKIHTPQIVNPREGFVRSANQQPVTQKSGMYLGWDYREPFRARRIRQALKKDTDWTWKSMLELQSDDLNLLAEMAIPLMLRHTQPSLLNDEQKTWLSDLKEWDFVMRATAYEPTIFTNWWQNMEEAIWKDEFGSRSESVFPKKVRTLTLLQETGKETWVDRKNTEEVETLPQVVTQSLLATFKNLKENFGSQPKNDWRWGLVHPAKFPHMAQIPGLGHPEIIRSGSENTVHVNNVEHGATWQMIVSMEPQVKAWGNYPGGQSGNPFSSEFTEFLPKWEKNELRRLHFVKNTQEAEEKFNRRWVLVPKKGGKK